MLHTGTEKSAWASFYEGREGEGYLAYAKERYKPFIGAINQRILPGDMVLEIGCGTGTITKALHDTRRLMAVSYWASDIDPQMVKISHKRFELTPCAAFHLDAVNPRTDVEPNVVHSHGMLEHFDDDTIRQVIHNFRHARVQVHYVPGLYDEPTFGAERLLSVEQWEDICAPDQIIKFNDGLDYALVFERG